jgi:hypothetical protein
MFRVTNKDGSDNAVIIQGARARSTSNNIASVVFQNYDDDTKVVYNMASIGVRDHFGSGESNGFGDLLLMTRNTSNALAEHFRLTYDGKVGLGASNPQYKLHVEGDVYVSNKIITNEIQANIYTEVVSQSNNVVSDIITASNAYILTGAFQSITASNIVAPAALIAAGTFGSIAASNIVGSNVTVRNTLKVLDTLHVKEYPICQRSFKYKSAVSNVYGSVVNFERQGDYRITGVEFASSSSAPYMVRLYNVTHNRTVGTVALSNFASVVNTTMVCDESALNALNSNVLELHTLTASNDQTVTMDNVVVVYNVI